MKKGYIWGAATAFALFVGCGHGKMIKTDPEASKVSKAGVIAVSSQWIKDKKKRWDAMLVLENLSKQTLIVSGDDIKCFRGDTEGIVHGVGHAIDVPSGGTKTATVQCDTRSKEGGDFRIEVGKVYSNPNNDGVTRGNVVATGLQWRQPSYK